MKVLAVIFFIIILVILAMTNPSQEAFKEYMEDRIESENNSGSGLEGVLRDLFSGPISDIVSENTERENYYIFSLYTFRFNEKDHTFIGIAGKIFPLEESLKEQFQPIPEDGQ